MISAAEAKLRMAEREYYPDFTLTANYYSRGGGQFQDMWSLTSAINIPLYYRTKQREAVLEAEASLSEAKRELDSAKLMTASAMRENYSMFRSSGRLMELYRNGLVPRTEQDFESALSGYSAGRSDAMTVISRLRAVVESEISYWVQYAEYNKSSVRFHALSGSVSLMGGNK
jgi:outer membrane protein TolC